MNSYESIMAVALMSSDPADRRNAEDKITLKMLASKLIWCPCTTRVLDQATTVVIERIADEKAVGVMHADGWDAIKDTSDIAAAFPAADYRIIDGRVLFAKNGR